MRLIADMTPEQRAKCSYFTVLPRGKDTKCIMCGKPTRYSNIEGVPFCSVECVNNFYSMFDEDTPEESDE